jgi:hypothetical protein
VDQNPPRENCPEAANDCAVQRMVKENPASQFDEQGLN